MFISEYTLISLVGIAINVIVIATCSVFNINNKLLCNITYYGSYIFLVLSAIGLIHTIIHSIGG